MPARKVIKKTETTETAEPKTIVRKITTRASIYSPEIITKQLSELKLKTSQYLGEITDELLTRSEILRRLEEDIEIKKQALAQIEEVKLAGKSLADLLKQIQQTRQDWEREQEEHNYQAKTALKRNAEEFAQLQNHQAQQLKEREVTVKEAEAELEQLRQKVLDLEKKLAEILEKQKNSQQNYETEKRVSELKTAGLEQTIKKLETEVQYWRDQAEKATSQVKELAVEALKNKTPSVDSN
jgi:chromosome segregation ATPase